jgi:carbamoyl-phosphate synthase large subunit
MNNKKLPILITGIGGGGHGAQILKAIRLSKGDRYFIVGADANSKCTLEQYTDEFVRLPLASEANYMERLFAVCDKFDIKSLFHGSEPELKQFSLERKRIHERGIFLPINDQHLIDTCMNKEKTNQLLAQLGFSAPRYVRIETKDELDKIDWFPVIVKPSVGGGGSANVYIAQNLKELHGLADYLGLELIADNFIIQEYVGTPESEYTVGVLHDMDGNYINAIAVKRMMTGQLNIRTSIPNRTGRTELGPKLVVSSGVSHGEISRHELVTEQCKEIAAAIGAKGTINIQCRLVDGVVKVFEINPRFSGTTSLRAMAGYNEPDILMRKHIFGEEIKTDFTYDSAIILRGLKEYKCNVSVAEKNTVVENTGYIL